MSTHRTEWHAAPQDLAGYLAGDGSPVLVASLEAHLSACAGCRGILAGLAGNAERDAAWERFAEAIDRPSPTVLGRLTRGHWFARSAIATPAMVRAALLAVVLVALVPLATGLVAGGAGLMTLLVLAPLAPVAAVALAYREWADPSGEMSLAAPSAGLRLVTLRALVVSLAALPLAVVTLLAADAWVQDAPLRLAFAWCLPGLALAALVLLAGTTRMDPLHVAVAVGAGWAVTVTTTAFAHRSLRPEALADVVASPAMQTAALGVAVAALLLTVVRRDAVAYRRTA